MPNIDYQLHRLQNLDPYLIDATLRENAVGSTYGQTLSQKLSIFSELRRFGLSKIILGALNYAYPDEPQVDDDLMMYLRDNNIDMTGCYCLTDIGAIEGGIFSPSYSQLKMKDYRVPNTLHEVYLSSERTLAGHAEVLNNISESVLWLRNNIAECGEVILNIVDGCDAFSNNTRLVEDVLRLAASLKLDGVSIEDDRGTYFPFQVANTIKKARALLPAPIKLLVHFHASNGMENASTIEALLNGADGAWGGLIKCGGVSGHASLAELIGNLVRLGNINIGKFRVTELLPLTSLVDKHCGVVSDAAPVYGKNIYRLNLSYFKQNATRFLDLAPETIGGSYTHQICPVMSDTQVIAERLKEAYGIGHVQRNVLECMIFLMRRSLRAGLLVCYDEPANLLDLYTQAQSATQSK